LAVVAVQRLAFFGVDDAYRDFGVALQCMAQPARDLVTGQGGAVQWGVFKFAELQR
jgi:hypothetical protein